VGGMGDFNNSPSYCLCGEVGDVALSPCNACLGWWLLGCSPTLLEPVAMGVGCTFLSTFVKYILSALFVSFASHNCFVATGVIVVYLDVDLR
jgi:hypothetical protein